MGAVVVKTKSAAYVGVVIQDGQRYGPIFLYEEEWTDATLFGRRWNRRTVSTIDWAILQEPEFFSFRGTLSSEQMIQIRTSRAFALGAVNLSIEDVQTADSRLSELENFVQKSEFENYNLVATLVEFASVATTFKE